MTNKKPNPMKVKEELVVLQAFYGIFLLIFIISHGNTNLGEIII